MYAFGEFCQLIRNRIGIELPEQSRDSLDTFLISRTKELGYKTIPDYLKSLYEAKVSDPPFQELVDVTTNGKTLFFRHLDQLNDIRDLIVHYWKKNERPPSVWSAGCATGEEVYSLAIIADEIGVPIEILGTDVCMSSIQTAMEGTYGGWQLENTGRTLPNCYFTRQNGQLTVADAIKQRVRFQQHNLLDFKYPKAYYGCWDIILCRNVFIYFHRDTVVKVLDRMTRNLAMHGMFFTGPSESMHGLHGRFKLVKLGESFGYELVRPGENLGERIATPPISWSLPTSPSALPVFPRLSTKKNPEKKAEPQPQVSKDTRSIVQQAIEAHQRGDFASAIHFLNRNLEEEPADWVGRVTLGNVYLMTREYAKSLEQYTTALDLDPLSAEAHFFLGMLHRKTGQWEQAIAALKRTLFLDGSFWLATFYLARLYAASGQRRLALREYQHTLQILTDPDQRTLPLRSSLHGLGSVQRYQQDISTVCRAKLGELGGA